MSDVLGRLAAALSDRYAVERELGSGGMAVVYLAEDLRHERRVAIKVLRPELTSVVAAERFLREIKLTAGLTHPHILPLHDSGEADGFLYYVMPYVEGESLRERLNRDKQLPVDEAVRIAREVADALSYAHGRDLLHRDIKPENILLAEGHAMVADFGIARALTEAGGDRLTDTGISIGTPIYVSPEQAAGERELSEASDVYSLACVLYEMLTGEPPVMDSSVQRIVSRKLLGEFRPVSELRNNVSAEIDATVSRALATEPTERFANAAEFAEAVKGTGKQAGRGLSLRRVLALYVTASAGVLAIAYAITMQLGLPDWFFVGSVLLLLVNLPIVLTTTLVQKQGVTGGRQRLRRFFTWRKSIAGGVLALTLWGVVATGWLVRAQTVGADSGSADAVPSIAVLPFENLSPDSGLAFFADGVHIDLLEVLTKIGALRVIPRSSVEAYRELRPDLRQIGLELGVSNILVGSVRRDGQQIKISVQLLDSQESAQIWAESYQRTLKDLFVVQADIAQRVADALQAELTQAEEAQLATPPTTNQLAYDLYLRGQTLLQSGFSDQDEIREAFERAVQLDPDFGLAWAALSRVRGRGEGAREALDRAIALDPGSFEVLSAQGFWHVLQGDFDRASQFYEEARKARPGSAEAWAAGAGLLQRQGRWDESVERYEHAAELDPLNPDWRIALGYAYRRLRQFERAERHMDRAIVLDPANSDYLWLKFQIILATGDTARAARYRAESLETVDPRASAVWDVQLAWYRRDYPSFLEAARLARRSDTDFTYGWYWPSLAHLLTGQVEAQRVLADSMRDWGESSLQRLSDSPDDANRRAYAHFQAAAGYALLGEVEQARHHAEQTLTLVDISADALDGPRWAWNVGNIYLLIGDVDTAIDLWDEALAVPSTTTTARFRLDPRYDVIRDDPRFQALLAKYE